jgi:SAM-dependent methyltransferase
MNDKIGPSEIEAHLLEHPCVNEVIVLPSQQEGTPQRMEAYVVPDFPRLKQMRDRENRYGDDHLIDRWNRLYEVTYSTGPAAPSFIGWKSSYTREAIPDAEMQQWLLATVNRIGSLRPRKVLEIGSGVGLLVQHLAPSTEEYVATDISRSAVKQLSGWLSPRRDLKHVEVMHRSATELGDLEPGRFDTVVLNSVVQYFPNIEYLLTVLRGAARLVTSGGRIFVGDVRNLRLLTMFHSAVQLSRAPPSTTVRELRKRIVRAMAQETELVIDPAFFTNLTEHQVGIGSVDVDVQLRRGRAANELTRYRYDAVLHVGVPRRAPSAAKRLTWQEMNESGTSLDMMLCSQQSPVIHISSIPNRRLAKDAAAEKLIETCDAHVTAAMLRERLADSEVAGIDPEELWESSERHGYEACVSWGALQPPEYFDVVLANNAVGGTVSGTSLISTQRHRLVEYANNPLENSIGYQFTQQLRRYLQGRLCEAMIPSDWTVLKQLPRTHDGQVDRYAFL